MMAEKKTSKDEHKANRKKPIPKEVQAIVKAMTADSDIRVEFDLSADSTIELLGHPIHALNPVINNGTLPAKFLSHRLIKDRYFFALPQELWKLLHQDLELGIEVFDKDLMELENAATRICGDCAFNVGLRSGAAFSYALLCTDRRCGRISVEQAKSIGLNLNQVALDYRVDRMNARLKPLTSVARGYVGWLMSNKQFLDEHDAIISKWINMVRRWGFDRLGILPLQGMFLPGDDPTTDPQWSAYGQAFEEFFTRWRLQGLVAPYLPIPLQPLMAGNLPVTVLPQLTRAGGVFCIPDTFPVPSRDELRNLLEGAIHGGQGKAKNDDEHLKEWMKLIAKDNAAKKPILRFGRLFLFQHYYRTLHHRHARSLHGKSSIVREVLAEFLGKVSMKTIKSDVRFLRKQLGKDWPERGRSSSIGPF